MSRTKAAVAAAFTLLTLFSFSLMVQPIAVNAQTDQEKILGQLCEGDSNLDVNCDKASSDAEVENIATRVISTAAWIAGIVSLVVMIVGGIMYVVSSGSPEQTARARSAIIYALVGLIVSAAAVMLVEFTLAQLENPDSSQLAP